MSKLCIVICIFLTCACEDKINRSVVEFSMSQKENEVLLQKYQAILVQDTENTYVSLKKHSKKDCNVCHRNDISDVLLDKLPQAHFDIDLNHANRMMCNDCHEKTPHNLKAFEKVDLKHSYLLCGKCHFAQLKDWRGGAHGKRLTGWQKVRIIENCVACHNPHSPKWHKRYPLMRPNIVPQRLGEQNNE